MQRHRLRMPNSHIPKSHLPLAFEVLHAISKYDRFNELIIPWLRTEEDYVNYREETAKTLKEVNLAISELGGFVILAEFDNRSSLVGIDAWYGDALNHPGCHIWHVAGMPPQVVIPLHRNESIDELRQTLQGVPRTA